MHKALTCTLPRGVTKAGEEVVILPWEAIEPLSRQQGAWLRAYCPVHKSDHQRSLSINPHTGWGRCFSCRAKVLVEDLNPRIATCLLRQESPRSSQSLSFQPQPARTSLLVREATSRPKVEPWQEEERRLLASLQADGALRLDREEAWNAQAYLEARRIPLDLAITTGVGYVEPGASKRSGLRLLQRWEDRLLFPLIAYDQHQRPLEGFAGRLLWQWQCCQDETAHKAWLERHEQKRWVKTNPAGWFWEPQHLPPSSASLIIVEGPFDRLAILAAGDFAAGEVVALVGTALQPAWLSQVHEVLLALDDDQGGREASQRIERHLAWKQIAVEVCRTSSPDDRCGKDWSERWRRAGKEGLESLYAQQALLAHNL